VEAFDKLKKIIASVEDDMSKAIGGNKAAGTRVRQSMQDVKSAAQEIREAILQIRSASDTEPGTKK
jgi:Histone H1-like protein Hc1